MRILCGLISWLWVIVAAIPAEVVAWKVPLSKFAENGLKSAGVTRLESPPAPSPFFKAGDALWNLKGIAPEARIETEPPLEWVVWNATSGRLVTRSDGNGLWQLHRRLKAADLPRQCRMTLDLFPVPDDGAPLAENAATSSSVTWLGRSSQRVDLEQHQGAGGIKVNAEVTIGENAFLLGVKLVGTCRLPNQPDLEFHNNFFLRSGERLWIIRDFDGKTGVDVAVRGGVELLDGTPFSEAILMQRGNTIVPMKALFPGEQRHRIGEKGLLITSRLDLDQFARFIDPKRSQDEALDPFAEAVPEIARKPVCVPELDVPGELKPWFGAPVLDARSILKNAGFDLKDGVDFAGYDPASQTIFLISNNELLLDQFEQFFDFCEGGFPKMIAVRFDGNGQSRIVAWSGTRNGLQRKLGGAVRRSIEIEPTLGEDDDMVDLSIEYEDKTRPEAPVRLNSDVTLLEGVPLEVLSGSFQEQSSSLRVKANIVHTEK